MRYLASGPWVVMAWVWGGCLLAGCQDSVPPCEETAFAVTTTCLSVAGDPSGVWAFVQDDGTQPVLDFVVSGTVEAIGDAAKDTSCFGSYASVDDSGEIFSAATAYLSLRDGDDVLWTMGSLIPGGLAGFEVGDAVTAHFVGWVPGFGLVPRALTVTRNGEPAFWVGEAPAFEALTQPPGYELSRGEAVCRSTSDCGSYIVYELAVTGASSGSVVGYPPSDIGPDRVFNAGVAFETGGTGRCFDWWVYEASGAIVYGGAP